jgi:UPF0716 protein FxsA
MRFRFFPTLAAVIIGMSLLDGATLVLIGNHLGLLGTFALVLFSGFVGSWLAKSQGLKVWRGIQRDFAQGRVPTEGLMDGAIVLVAGGLLIAPGFLTDIIGLLLLLPPVRVPIKRLVRRRLEQQLISHVGVYAAGPAQVVDINARIE